jgi:urea transport system permease protein
LTGAVIGAIVVGSAKSNLSEAFPEIWQYFLGALFIGSVVLFPAGIVGFVRMVIERLRGVAQSERPTDSRPIIGAREEAEAQVVAHGE